MSIVAVGGSSFIARHVLEQAGSDWMGLSHDEALRDDGWLRGVRCVVNFAYDPDSDFDSRLAQMVQAHPIHYVMLSTRLVYGRHDELSGLRESDPLNPQGAYAERKAAAERAVAAMIRPERLTILRLANIFGYEVGRRTFFGMMMTSLKREGVIRFDMAPDSMRDFMPLEACAAALIRIAQAPVQGVFNLGTGAGTACGAMAAALINGFGNGRVEVEGGLRDQYWLDMAKTHGAYAFPAIPATMPEQVAGDLGRKLRASPNY